MPEHCCSVLDAYFHANYSGGVSKLLDDLAASQCRRPICFGLSTVHTCHSNDEDPRRYAVGNNKTANSTLRLKCINSTCH